MTDEIPQEDATTPEAAGTAVAESDAPPKLTQEVELKDIGPCKKHIKVTIERSCIDERLNEKFKEISVGANVAGFRPGKAPRKIIEKRFLKDVSDQVKAELLLQSLEQLAEEHDIAPLAAPNIDPFKIEIPKAGPLVYEFEVEVRPDFEMPSYKGLKIKRPMKVFSDQDVEAETRRILSRYAKVEPKEQGDAQIGDILVADVVSRDGDRELSRIADFTVRIDQQLAFKDGLAKTFSEQVKGAKKGDKRLVDITLSNKAADTNLHGKTVQATFEIKEVRSFLMPELTHEFLHNFGVHTPDQLSELVRVMLQRRLDYLQRQSARQQIIQQIDAATKWDLPQDLLIRQASRAFKRRIMEMQAQGMSEEEIRGRQRVLEQDVIQNTALALKEHFVLQKIAELEDIDVTDDDLDMEIERIAEQNNEPVRRVRARIEKEDLFDALAAEIIERRALDLILETAEYEDVPLTGEEEGSVESVEEQTVPGEMADPMAVPPEAPASEEKKEPAAS